MSTEFDIDELAVTADGSVSNVPLHICELAIVRHKPATENCWSVKLVGNPDVSFPEGKLVQVSPVNFVACRYALDQIVLTHRKLDLRTGYIPLPAGESVIKVDNALDELPVEVQAYLVVNITHEDLVWQVFSGGQRMHEKRRQPVQD